MTNSENLQLNKSYIRDQFEKIQTPNRNHPLTKCKPNKGYIVVQGIGRYLSSNLHARINLRAGLCDYTVKNYYGGEK